MKQLILLSGLLFIATLSFCQKKVGIVLSSENKMPIQQAYVLSESGFSCYTDSAGNILSEHFVLGEKLTVVAAGFQTIYTKLVQWDQVFLLSPSMNVQTPLVITAGPNVVFSSETWNVGDFMWDNDGVLQLLVYEKEKRWKRQSDANLTIFENARVAFTSQVKEGQQWVSIPLNENAIGFYSQFPGEVIVQGERHFFLETDDQLVELPDSIFNAYIKPVVEKVRDRDFLVSDYQSSYPAFTYYRAKQDSQWVPLHFIQDEKEMELLRSEYKYLGPREKLEAFQFELDNKIDKEIIAAYMSGFSSKPYHSPLYAPLILLGDTILVFDHLHNVVTFYNQEGVKFDEISCHHHLQKGIGKWKGQVWRDTETHQLYTAYERNGKVKWMKMDVEKDVVTPCMELAFPYCEKIKVHNREVFFVYRPFESSQKRYLYKQKITNE